jgi:hypothetical protein
MNKIVVTIALLGLILVVKSQPNLDSIKAELYRVNKVFDSSRFLGFDVSIKYESDTLFGKFDYQELTGHYIVNSNNMYYRMGNTEFAQNDSFVYSIYHDEKMLMMTKDRMVNSKLFPLKEFVDSAISLYSSLYTITLTTEDEYRVIRFTSASNDAPYKRFEVHYENESYYPVKFQMAMRDALNSLNDIPDTIVQQIKIRPVEKRITMSFSKYYHPQKLEMFENKTYVLFDRLRKTYRPAERLKAYRFIANGIDGDRHDKSIELYPPPVIPSN